MVEAVALTRKHNNDQTETANIPSGYEYFSFLFLIRHFIPPPEILESSSRLSCDHALEYAQDISNSARTTPTAVRTTVGTHSRYISFV